MNIAASFPGFKLRLTRWGGIYLVLTLILAFAAVNTGNNALMATLGLALGAFAVSGSWSREILGRARIEISPPKEIFADSPALFDITLSNTSRLFPGYGLVIRDGSGRAVLFHALLGRGETCQRSAELVFDRRGWTSLEDWRLEVVLPLGFFVKSKVVARGQEVLVYPRLLRYSSARPRGGAGERRVERWLEGGREGEMTHLREYSDGDEMRQIHWKQTARQGRMISMERQHQSRASVVFEVDTQVTDIGDRRCLQAFERMISEIATAVTRHLEGGTAVGLIMPGVNIPPLCHRSQLPLLLRPLAEAEARAFDSGEAIDLRPDEAKHS